MIHVGAGQVARVDVGDAPERAVVFSAAQPRGAGGLDAAVRDALAAGGAPASRAWILDEATWTQTVDLPSAALEGLGAADAERALAYELEPVSGVPALEAAVASKALETRGARARFWVSSLRASTRQDAQSALAARGVALAGIASPAGVAPGGGDAAAQVEVWERCTFAAAGGARPVVIAAKAGGRSWEPRLLEWLGALGAAGSPVDVEWRGRARPTPALLAIASARLDDRGALAADGEGAAEWLRACARALADGDPPAPVVRAAPRPARRLRPLWLGVAAAVLAGAGVAYDAVVVEGRARELEKRATAADRVRERLAGETKSRAELVRKLGEVRRASEAKEAPVRRVEAEWAAARERPAALLKALVDKRPPSALLASIKPDPSGALEVRGIGVERAAVDEYVAELGPALRAAHWRVGPASATERLADSGRRFLEFAFAAAPEAAGPPDDAASRTRP